MWKRWVCFLVFGLISWSQAATILSDHQLIDLSNGVHNNNQTVWTTADGSVVSVSDSHWQNGNLYYVGYMVDGSYVYDSATGDYNTTGGAGGNPVHGYLSNSHNTVTVDVNFASEKPVALMRMYPVGWNSSYVTDYKVEYKDSNGVFQEAIARQTVTSSQVPSGVDPHTLFNDHEINVTAKEWRITLINGEGGWQGNASFNEIQFFESTNANQTSNVAVPEPSSYLLGLLTLLFSASTVLRNNICKKNASV